MPSDSVSMRALLWPTPALSGARRRTMPAWVRMAVMVWPMSSCSCAPPPADALFGLQQPLGELAIVGELAGQRLVELALALDAGAEQQAGEALGQQESSRSSG